MRLLRANAVVSDATKPHEHKCQRTAARCLDSAQGPTKVLCYWRSLGVRKKVGVFILISGISVASAPNSPVRSCSAFRMIHAALLGVC